MKWLFHCGERVNWLTVAFLGWAVVLLFLTRLLPVLFWWRRLRKAQRASDAETEESEFEKITMECLNPRTHPVPIFVSFLYCAVYLVFAMVVIGGTVSTVWWVLPLGLLAAVLVHIPFRETMATLTLIERLRVLGTFVESLTEDE